MNCMSRRGIRNPEYLLSGDIIYFKILMVIFIEDIERVGVVSDYPEKPCSLIRRDWFCATLLIS